MLEKTLESPLDCKEIQPVHRKGHQSWILIGRTDAEAPVLWPPDSKSWLLRKDPDAGKDWKQEEKGTTEDEMVGGHHRLDGHEFEEALGVVDGQGGLACCSPWGHKESDTAEWLNWTEWTCHSVLQWTMFCQNSPTWLVHLGWHCMARLIASMSYIRLWPIWSLWLAFCDSGFRSAIYINTPQIKHPGINLTNHVYDLYLIKELYM